jgi:hypothetical protein
VVYDHAGFSAQGGLEAMLSDVAAGEEVRIAERLPIKLFLVDDTVALVPVSDADDDQAAAVLVYRSGLLSGLAELFEQLWERSTPFCVANGRHADVPGPPLDDDSHRLLAMLRAGFTDLAIARQLGTSTRTVQRRIRVLMEAAAVDTRFQLGARATALGWIDGHARAGHRDGTAGAETA